MPTKQSVNYKVDDNVLCTAVAYLTSILLVQLSETDMFVLSAGGSDVPALPSWWGGWHIEARYRVLWRKPPGALPSADDGGQRGSGSADSDRLRVEGSPSRAYTKLVRLIAR